MIKIRKNSLIQLGAAFIFAALYFCLLMYFYAEIEQDMGEGYYLPILAPVILLLTFAQWTSGKFLISPSMLPNLLTGILWCGTFPLLYQWTYNSPWYLSKICFDFLVGTGLIILLTSLEVLLTGKTNKIRKKSHKNCRAFNDNVKFYVYGCAIGANRLLYNRMALHIPRVPYGSLSYKLEREHKLSAIHCGIFLACGNFGDNGFGFPNFF